MKLGIILMSSLMISASLHAMENKEKEYNNNLMSEHAMNFKKNSSALRAALINKKKKNDLLTICCCPCIAISVLIDACCQKK